MDYGDFIVLTAKEAEKIREATRGREHALDPVALKDGKRFILPARVLDDPRHKKMVKRLRAHKRANIDRTEFIEPEDDIEVAEKPRKGPKA